MFQLPSGCFSWSSRLSLAAGAATTTIAGERAERDPRTHERVDLRMHDAEDMNQARSVTVLLPAHIVPRIEPAFTALATAAGRSLRIVAFEADGACDGSPAAAEALVG
jgi:hypothetical protein